MRKSIHKKIVQADLKQARRAQRNHQKHLQNQERIGKEELSTGLAQLAHIGQGCQSSLFLTLLALNSFLQYQHVLAQTNLAQSCDETSDLKLVSELTDLLGIDRENQDLNPLSETDYKKISELLERGVRPSEATSNDIPAEWNTPFKRVLEGDFRLAELLVQNEFKPTSLVFDALLQQLKKTEIGQPRSMEHKRYEDLTKQIATSEDIAYLNQEMIKKYNQFDALIQNAKIEAVKQGKPLMILLGEVHNGHDGVNSLLMELLMLHIAINRYNVKTFLTEYFCDLRYDFWIVGDEVCNLIKQRDRSKIIELDEASRDLTNPLCGYGFTREKFNCRDKIMREIATAYRPKLAMDEDAVVGIVGAMHLLGLTEDINLKDVYYIVPVNMALTPEDVNNSYLAEDDEKEYEAELSYVSSQNVVQATLNKGVYFSPQMAQQLSEATYRCAQSEPKDRTSCQEKSVTAIFSR